MYSNVPCTFKLQANTVRSFGNVCWQY
jgi:hypothetical protein